VRLAMLVETRAVDAFSGIGMRLETARIDRGTALVTDTVFVSVYAPQRRGYLDHFLARLVTQRVNHFTVFELFRTLLGVWVITTAEVGRDSLQARIEFFLFVFELSPQCGVGFLWHGQVSL